MRINRSTALTVRKTVKAAQLIGEDMTMIEELQVGFIYLTETRARCLRST